MATEKFDYARLLNDIDAKIAALQTLRASAQAASALGALGQPIEGAEPPSLAPGRNDTLGVPTDLPEGAFNGKSVPACVELYLSAAKKKKTNKEIAAALREGGVESKASNFENVVTGALFGLKKAGKVLRFKDGWGLAEWYPAHLRGGAASGPGKRSAKNKKKRVTDRAKAPVVASNTASSENITEIGKPGDKPEPRILAFLKKNREVTAKDVASALGLKIQTINLVLAKLAHRNKIEKVGDGHFRAMEVAVS